MAAAMTSSILERDESSSSKKVQVVLKSWNLLIFDTEYAHLWPRWHAFTCIKRQVPMVSNV